MYDRKKKRKNIKNAKHFHFLDLEKKNNQEKYLKGAIFKKKNNFHLFRFIKLEK